jgi:S1-C subfamily serine protease
MKPILLIAGSAFALNGALVNGALVNVAFAADKAPATQAAPIVAPATSASADPKPNAAPVAAPSKDAAAQAAKTEEARKELAELRTQMQELSRKMATLSTELGEGGPRSYAYRYIGDPDRAIIGVVLDRDDKGVRLSAVTPDGPAARAGLRDGDIITAIDRQSVVDTSSKASFEKAHTLLANLKAGQNVSINYLRGSDTGVVTLAAERREAWNWPMLMNDDPEHSMLPKDFDERMRAEVERAQREAERSAVHDKAHMQAQVERAQREAERSMEHDRTRMQADASRAARDAMRQMRTAMPWWGLNLAPLNADLGRYFGTDKGVLVIAADQDSLPGIRGGDVITSIGGEPVNRPEDALRALRDQESGKDVAIKLLRDRKTLALNMKAPAFKSIFDMRVAPPAPPAPPAAPAAAAAPAVPAPPAAPAPVATPAAPPAVPEPADPRTDI